MRAHTEEFDRFAVDAAPQPGPLAEFGAGWPGWEPATGVTMEHPRFEGLRRPVADLTAMPRKYGFHGTLKPPFRLAEGSSRAALEIDVARLAATLSPVELEGLNFDRLGGFLALCCEGNTRALEWLAADVLTKLDAHRAPGSETERARRGATGLTPWQLADLARWGYVDVVDEFRVHFTLTGKLTVGEAQVVDVALAPVLSPLVPRPFTGNALVLCGGHAHAMFHMLHRYALTG